MFLSCTNKPFGYGYKGTEPLFQSCLCWHRDPICLIYASDKPIEIKAGIVKHP